MRQAKRRCSKRRGLYGRDQLEAAIRLLERGDTLLAINPDRLARDTADLLTIGKRVVEQGAVLKILDPAITFDGTDIMAEALLTLFGMIGRIEKHFIKERQRRGIEAAKAKGVYKARPRPLIRRRSVNSPNKGLVERRSLVVSGSAVPVSIGCSPVKMLRPHDPLAPGFTGAASFQARPKASRKVRSDPTTFAAISKVVTGPPECGAAATFALKLFGDLIRNAGLAGCDPANPVLRVVWARMDNLPRRKPHAPVVRVKNRPGAETERPCFVLIHRSCYAEVVTHHDQGTARRAAIV